MFKEVKVEDFDYSAVRLIGKDWLLVTGETAGKANAMTASWGGLGVMWGKNVAYIVLRPQRYTKEFVDKAERFTLSIFGEDRKPMMSYFGSVSGRDEDKIAKSGLTVISENGCTYYEEAKYVMICRKLYAQAMTADSFIDKSCDEQWYGAGDYHTLYIAEIEKLLVNE